MASAIRELRWFARRHRLVLGLVACAVAAAIAWLLLRDPEEPAGAEQVRTPAAAVPAVAQIVRSAVPLEDLSGSPEPKLAGPRFGIAQVREGARIALRDRPGGEVLVELDDQTDFGSTTTLWVARTRGDWLGVPAPELDNGELGWVRDDRTKLEIFQTHFWLIAYRSSRVLELRYGKRLLDRYSVTVGRPGSETPLGAFSVTDALAGPTLGPWYGCCALALSGHQPNLPPGWFGGDRMAIHGTPGALGVAASAGCIRASDETLVSLFARVPLGTPVFVRP